MKPISIAAAALITLTVGFLVALIGLVVVVAEANLPAGAQPSAVATDDIAPALVDLFIAEAGLCPGLPWTVMAGISKVESDHARYGGSTVTADGTVAPPIIGIPLDGTRGTARVPDTDNGLWDGDRTWDRAVGPFQFIPSSWRIFGTDGNGDGTADPNNIYDAVPAMRRHLCPEGTITDIRAAVFSYNRSTEYVDAVLDWANEYTGGPAVLTTAIGSYSLPVDPALLEPTDLVRPHHDYPAWDFGTPVGTAVYSMTEGTVVTARTAGTYPADHSRCGTTVTIAGDDGAIYTYCHLSHMSVSQGQWIEAGTILGLSGGQPGRPGAGNTTGPHLHLSIRVNGQLVCPQGVLVDLVSGRQPSISTTASVGCINR